MSDDMLKLAERVAAAASGDNNLDTAILNAIVIVREEGALVWYEIDGKPYTTGHTPPYTASLDAAMTLVPEGYLCSLGNEPLAWWAHVGPRDDPDSDETAYTGATPALALCAASLRARSAA